MRVGLLDSGIMDGPKVGIPLGAAIGELVVMLDSEAASLLAEAEPLME